MTCIRPFRADDAEAVAAMVAALNAEEGYDPAKAPDAAALSAAFLGATAAGRLLVAVDAVDRPLGYATIHTIYETAVGARGAYLGDLYVTPEARRQGIGRRLVAAAARLVRAEGGVFLWWTALPGNARAHGFYRALGAEEEALQGFTLGRAAFHGLAGA